MKFPYKEYLKMKEHEKEQAIAEKKIEKKKLPAEQNESALDDVDENVNNEDLDEDEDADDDDAETE